MVAGIWGQTRSYGDTYHWAFHDGTVESVSAVPVFFLRRREPGAGDEVAGDISQPGGVELSDEGAQARRLWASGNFGSGCAALRNARVNGLRMGKAPEGLHRTALGLDSGAVGTRRPDGSGSCRNEPGGRCIRRLVIGFLAASS